MISDQSATVDFVAGGVASSQAAGVNTFSYSYGPLASLPVFLTALAVCVVEWRQKTSASANTHGRGVSLSIFGIGRLMMQLFPEFVMLMTCSLIATAVVIRSDNHGTEPTDELSKESWNQIKSEWPVLMTADTLLALQAMVRLVLCISAATKSKEVEASPFSNEPVAFFFLASLVRVTLLSISPWDWFHLDGPLGGSINFAFELIALPFLFYFSRTMIRQSWHRRFLLVAAILVASVTAWCNHYNITEPGYEYMNVMFSLTQCLEFAAAATFLARTITLGSDSASAFTWFVHALLPVQQAFSMYFLLTAFAPPLQSIPEIVGAGRPFELYEIAGLVQVGMYLFAAAMHFVFVASMDTKEPGSYLEVGLQLAQGRERSASLDRAPVFDV